MNINQLLKLFTPLNKEQKELLFNMFLEILQLDDRKKKDELLRLLEDFKEDLLYYDEDLEKERDDEKIYFTQEELAEMFDVSRRTIQRIIEKNKIKPLNKGSKPYYYDFDEFKEYYFVYKSIKKSKTKDLFCKYYKEPFYLAKNIFIADEVINSQEELYMSLVLLLNERGEQIVQNYQTFEFANSIG